jgi:hypothetical protein
MKKMKLILAVLLLVISLTNNAQTKFGVSKELWTEFPDSIRNKIIKSLDDFLYGIEKRNIDTALIDKDNYDFNYNFFTYLGKIETKDTVSNYFKGQLINLYLVEPMQYSLTLIYANGNETGRIFTFMAKEHDGKIVFESPVKYNTKHWKTATFGTITIHYPDTINVNRAKDFDRKNVMMASKLNLPVMYLEMYMSRNYQEALQLQGCLYEYGSNGYTNSGDIVDPKTVFAVKNDEDFSHDVLHMYAAKIRGKIRNAAAEEGIAYLWGNAYHVGSKGKIPDQQELIPTLRQHIKSHVDTDLLDLFDKNPNVLAEYGYPKPISVKAIISGLVCEELEKQKGVEGIIELMKCGRGDDNFFTSIDKLMHINRNNFDASVRKLLFNSPTNDV